MINFGKRLRNVGSAASSRAKGKAQNTALGKAREKHIKHYGQGSSAGLNAEKSAWIQPDTPASQSPRMNATPPRMDTQSGIMFRTSLGVSKERRSDLRKFKGLFK